MKYEKNNGYIIKNNIRKISLTEFHSLKYGDTVFVKCGGQFYRSKVVRSPFYNADADQPDWEVETTNGFCDEYSLYISA